MAIQNKDLPRFSIVAEKPYVKRILIAAAAAWLLTAAALAWSLYRLTDSNAFKLESQLSDSRARERQAVSDLDALKQELANTKRAEFISRSANNQIQTALAEKDEQIAGLKADLDFYERLVGSSGRRHGLIVHDAAFAPASDGAWRYTVTLTQNINRGGTTTGQMRFDVEGVSAGKLRTVRWNELLQDPGAPGQKFAFRYFQQLEGAVMLPAGFSPQRVRVALKGPFGGIEKSFSWEPPAPAMAGSNDIQTKE
ncbi:MAG TPA: DUF6776 family protein [Arenimonas sp.]|nr:DUF6776 family protein [Arenimonas sp.]